MKRTTVLSIGALHLLLGPGTALAGPNIGASVGFHVQQPPTSTPCSFGGTTTGQLIPSFPGFTFPSLGDVGAYVYLIVCGGSLTRGVGGLSCGIDYNGIYSPSGGGVPGMDPALVVLSWNLCADAEFPTPGWPAPGTGNRVVWNSVHCQQQPTIPSDQTSAITVAGYFYMGVYNAGRMWVRLHPETRHVTVTACSGTEDHIEAQPAGGLHLGYADFGGGFGHNACDYAVVPTESSGWGVIKSHYG